MRLIPRDGKFHDLFNEQADNIHNTARQLVVLFGDFREVEKRVAEIKSAELKGDQITRSVTTKLNQTFAFDGSIAQVSRRDPDIPDSRFRL